MECGIPPIELTKIEEFVERFFERLLVLRGRISQHKGYPPTQPKTDDALIVFCEELQLIGPVLESVEGGIAPLLDQLARLLGLRPLHRVPPDDRPQYCKRGNDDRQNDEQLHGVEDPLTVSGFRHQVSTAESK